VIEHTERKAGRKRQRERRRDKTLRESGNSQRKPENKEGGHGMP